LLNSSKTSFSGHFILVPADDNLELLLEVALLTLEIIDFQNQALILILFKSQLRLKLHHLFLYLCELFVENDLPSFTAALLSLEVLP
jgi:hypothetical protein